MVAERRLVLIRHAKSAYPHGVPDHERPLAGKGRRHALAAGRWLLTEGPRIGLALCSDATRARHTWEIIHAELLEAGIDVPTTQEPDLYGAEPEEVVELVQAVPADVATVAVIGHEPTMSGVVKLLAEPGTDADMLATVTAKFGTSGIAVLRFRGAWPDLHPSGARLESYVKPRH